jgi:uncharacterized protein (DUF58 family)
MPAQRRYPTALLLASACLVAGLASRSPGLLVLSIPFFTYTILLLLSQSALPHPALTARRSPHADRAVAGEWVDVEMSVTNNGAPISYAAILDELPPQAVVVDGEPVYCGSIPAGATVAAAYTVSLQRGVHTQGHLRAFVWPRLGLAVHESRFDCSTFVWAAPQIDPLPAIVIRPRRIHAFAGPVHARSGGAGMEFFGCRSYASGDDVRRVNWRAFARSGRLFVNEYQQERMTDVVVVLDIRTAAHLKVGDQCTFEPCCRAAASLAAHFIRQGNRVGLLLYGNALDWIEPAGGRFHLEKVLAAITRAQPVRSLAFDELASLPVQLLPSGSQVVVVSSLARDGDELALASLHARGYSVLAVYVDMLELERDSQPQDPALELACRAMALRTSAAIRRMESLGVHVILWDVRRPLPEAIRASRLDRAERRLH